MMSLRERSWVLSEAITVQGVLQTTKRNLGKIKILISKTEPGSDLAIDLKRGLEEYARMILAIAGKIVIKKSHWQRIRGY